jgi:hypothetical protein
MALNEASQEKEAPRPVKCSPAASARPAQEVIRVQCPESRRDGNGPVRCLVLYLPHGCREKTQDMNTLLPQRSPRTQRAKDR